MAVRFKTPSPLCPLLRSSRPSAPLKSGERRKTGNWDLWA